MRYLLLALALGACATASPTPEALTEASPATVVAAERAFAARAGEIGWVPAFREYTAPDGQLGQPGAGYASAPDSLAETPDDGNRTLFWWPAFAGIARSGDFGFTTGVVSFDEARTPRGHYFTVWRRQPDGAWRWIYDGGVGPIADPNQIAPDAASVPAAPVSARGLGNADAASAAVRAIEQGGAVLSYAADARSYRTRAAPMAGAPSGAPAGGTFHVDRVEASAAGDLVMVLGTARWAGEAGPAEGLYARMWQYRPEGWRVIYDQLITPRPPPPPPPAN